MQRTTVQLFVIPVARCPAGPPDPPRELTVEADTQDGLRAALLTRLTADGYRVRSIAFGPTGLMAYAEETP